jgi:hypothetical protein
VAQTLTPDQWRNQLELLSRALDGRPADVEIASLALGDQFEAEWIAFRGITYDRKLDAVNLMLENFDHPVPRPRSLHARARLGRLESLEIVDADGAKHIIKFREPLMLPAPDAGHL